jgi:2-polyprenyl-6-methoxyphenol hydroxylase-like FAD-dependent oxidoreductase
VYKRLRSIDTPPGWKSPIRFLRTATGEQLGVIDSKGFEGPGPDVSPAWPVMSSQELIEAILLDAVRTSGMVEVRFATEATKLVRGGRRVTTALRSRSGHGRRERPRRSLVGRSWRPTARRALIREELGIELEGAKELLHIVNCYFRADIESHLGDRKGVLFFVFNEHASGVLQPLDAAGRWLCQISVQPQEWSLDVFTHERARAWIRAAVGRRRTRARGVVARVVEAQCNGRRTVCAGPGAPVRRCRAPVSPDRGPRCEHGPPGMHNAMWKLAWYVHGQAGWISSRRTKRNGVGWPSGSRASRCRTR